MCVPLLLILRVILQESRLKGHPVRHLKRSGPVERASWEEVSLCVWRKTQSALCAPVNNSVCVCVFAQEDAALAADGVSLFIALDKYCNYCVCGTTVS